MSHLFQYCMTGILVLFYSLTALIPSCQASTNLALGKSYTVSPLPLYPLTALPTDTTSLTDEKYTTGRFWIERSTVGWWPVSASEIIIDLGKSSVIDAITFNTAREEHNVIYPAQIHVFVGPDQEHLTYFGDMADQAKNLVGPYQVAKFELGGINAKGRFVLLEVMAPSSRSIFCDEIEVFEGQIDSGVVGNLGVDEVRSMLNVLKWDGVEQRLLQKFLENPKTVSNGINKLTARVNKSDQPAWKMAKPVDMSLFADRQEIKSLQINSLGASGPTEVVNNLLLLVRADVLRKEYPQKQILVEAINPWGPHTPFAPLTGKPLDQVALLTPAGGHENAAFLVTSLAQEVQKIDITLSNSTGESAVLSLYQAPFVRSAALEYVPDPLVPTTEITLQPGESRVIFIVAQGLAPSELQSLLNIQGKVVLPPIPVTVTVPHVVLPSKLSLNSVNWGYLSFPLIQYRMLQAVEDLQKHHTNIVVVPPSHLQGANQLKTVTLQDFNTLETYLKYHQGAAKVLLGVGFGTADRKTVLGKSPFLSSEWKDTFKKWYADAILAAGRAGFVENQIYLYPYDEMAGEQIDDFVRFAQWARQDIPNVKFYATFGEATLKSKQWDKALPYLDIVQSYDEKMLAGRDLVKTEAWIYDTGGNSRSLSPYTYYRLMAWKAFLKGYTGVGFWAYADTGKDTTAWNELERDFSVIYDGENQSIVSSRRWEAWRMGIEDYELLKMYAAKKGAAAAKAMAKSVLDNPKDIAKADQIRQTILTELSNN